MIELDISMTGLVVALFLPWLVGIAFTRALIGGVEQFNVALVVAYGYFFGTFLATLAVRLLDALGAPLNFTILAAGLALLGGFALFISRKPRGSRVRVKKSGPAMPGLSSLLIVILLGLLIWRYSTLLGDMILRPLYPWDAWMNWAPKAVVWFGNGELTPFVSPDVWLQGDGADGSYTLGNPSASTYPETVPLIFLWHMLGAGTSDHSLLQLPWLFAAINLGLVLFGHLRLAGANTLLATVGSYCLLSLPYLNIHTVLAGYADLWLAAAFSIGAFALSEWEKSRNHRLAIISLLAVFMCIQLKNPGIILGLILAAGLLRTKVGLSFRAEMLIVGGALAAIFMAFLAEIAMELPGLGPIRINTDSFQVGIFGPYKLEFHPQTTEPVVQSLFNMANWHLLWYVAALVLILRLPRIIRLQRPSSLAMVLVVGAAFYAVVFFFTEYYLEAVNLVTLNRAILYLMPTMIYYLCINSVGAASHDAD